MDAESNIFVGFNMFQLLIDLYLSTRFLSQQPSRSFQVLPGPSRSFQVVASCQVNGLSRADAEGLAKVLAEGLGHKKKAHALSLWHQGGGGRRGEGTPHRESSDGDAWLTSMANIC